MYSFLLSEHMDYITIAFTGSLSIDYDQGLIDWQRQKAWLLGIKGICFGQRCLCIKAILKFFSGVPELVLGHTISVDK